MELKKKVTLDKQGDSYNLPLLKKGESREISCNLNWTQNSGSGFLGRLFTKDVDLDLGVYYKLKNGESSMIDGLQFSRGRGGSRHQKTRQGYYDGSPWIWHAGDDLTGASSNGEFVYVNPNGLHDISRIQFYATIHDQKVTWGETDAEITVTVPGHPPIGVSLGNVHNRESFCLFCTIDISPLGIKVSNDTTFHHSRIHANDHYGWGFSFTRGSK